MKAFLCLSCLAVLVSARPEAGFSTTGSQSKSSESGGSGAINGYNYNLPPPPVKGSESSYSSQQTSGGLFQSKESDSEEQQEQPKKQEKTQQPSAGFQAQGLESGFSYRQQQQPSAGFQIQGVDSGLTYVTPSPVGFQVQGVDSGLRYQQQQQPSAGFQVQGLDSGLRYQQQQQQVPAGFQFRGLETGVNGGVYQNVQPEILGGVYAGGVYPTLNTVNIGGGLPQGLPFPLTYQAQLAPQVLPVQFDVRSGYDTPSYVKQAPIIHKHIYVHTAPPDFIEPPKPVALPAPPEKHIKIIFVKVPSPPAPVRPVIPVQQPNEEKTIVYVLVKKPEEQSELVIPTAPPTEPSRPEVYFIKYKGKKEEAPVPAPIVVQGDNLGGFIDTGSLGGINIGAIAGLPAGLPIETGFVSSTPIPILGGNFDFGSLGGQFDISGTGFETQTVGPSLDAANEAVVVTGVGSRNENVEKVEKTVDEDTSKSPSDEVPEETPSLTAEYGPPGHTPGPV